MTGISTACPYSQRRYRFVNPRDLATSLISQSSTRGPSLKTGQQSRIIYTVNRTFQRNFKSSSDLVAGTRTSPMNSTLLLDMTSNLPDSWLMSLKLMTLGTTKSAAQTLFQLLKCQKDMHSTKLMSQMREMSFPKMKLMLSVAWSRRVPQLKERSQKITNEWSRSKKQSTLC